MGCKPQFENCVHASVGFFTRWKNGQINSELIDGHTDTGEQNGQGHLSQATSPRCVSDCSAEAGNAPDLPLKAALRGSAVLSASVFLMGCH